MLLGQSVSFLFGFFHFSVDLMLYCAQNALYSHHDQKIKPPKVWVLLPKQLCPSDPMAELIPHGIVSL